MTQVVEELRMESHATAKSSKRLKIILVAAVVSITMFILVVAGCVTYLCLSSQHHNSDANDHLVSASRSSKSLLTNNYYGRSLFIVNNTAADTSIPSLTYSWTPQQIPCNRYGIFLFDANGDGSVLKEFIVDAKYNTLTITKNSYEKLTVGGHYYINVAAYEDYEIIEVSDDSSTKVLYGHDGITPIDFGGYLDQVPNQPTNVLCHQSTISPPGVTIQWKEPMPRHQPIIHYSIRYEQGTKLVLFDAPARSITLDYKNFPDALPTFTSVPLHLASVNIMGESSPAKITCYVSSNVLPSGGVINAGDYLTSTSLQYRLSILPNCKLVISDEVGHTSRAMSDTSCLYGTGSLEMRIDGNVMVYAILSPTDRVIVWSSQTYKHTGLYLVMADSGKVQLVQPDGVVYKEY